MPPPPQGKPPVEGGDGAGRTVRIAIASVCIGLIVVALNLTVYYLNFYSLLHLFPLIPGGHLYLALIGLARPVLEQLAPFLAIFAVAAGLRLNPFRGGIQMLVVLFMAGVFLGAVTFGIENKILQPILEPGTAAAQGSLAAQILSFSFAEAMAYQGVGFLFLALTALTMGYFWSENPLWRPWEWLHEEHEDDAVGVGRRPRG